MGTDSTPTTRANSAKTTSRSTTCTRARANNAASTDSGWGGSRSNIAPQEVEDALVGHPAVARAGVVGVHDLLHGETVWAYVALQPGADPPSASELIAFAADRVGYKAPEVVEVLDRIPVNAVGKTDRSTRKRMAAERHGTDTIR